MIFACFFSIEVYTLLTLAKYRKRWHVTDESMNFALKRASHKLAELVNETC